MNPLAKLDLDRFRIDSESFLGQAVALGIRFEKLPENAPDAMLVYLRTVGMTFAQRYRTGIGIARDGLERGVRQALVCMELGLEDAAGGDLNAAVDLLVGGDFEAFRKRGWEIAFFRLEEMRETTRGLLKRPEAAFFQKHLRDFEGWAHLVPETWSTPAKDEDEEEDRGVDPLQNYAAFREIKARLDFLGSLPGGALRELWQAAGEGRSFDDLIRNLILSLALDLETLVPDQDRVADFQSRCFEEGNMLPEVREKVLHLVDRHLETAVENEDARVQIRNEVTAEMAVLEEALGSGMEGFFIFGAGGGEA